MQPWESVQITNEDNPHHGRAGILIQVNRDNGQAVVKLDADATREAVEVAADVSELKRL